MDSVAAQISGGLVFRPFSGLAANLRGRRRRRPRSPLKERERGWRRGKGRTPTWSKLPHIKAATRRHPSCKLLPRKPLQVLSPRLRRCRASKPQAILYIHLHLVGEETVCFGPKVEPIADPESVFTTMQAAIAHSSHRSEAEISAAQMTKRSCKSRNRTSPQ